jgi:hypothetical protein
MITARRPAGVNGGVGGGLEGGRIIIGVRHRPALVRFEKGM